MYRLGDILKFAPESGMKNNTKMCFVSWQDDEGEVAKVFDLPIPTSGNKKYNYYEIKILEGTGERIVDIRELGKLALRDIIENPVERNKARSLIKSDVIKTISSIHTIRSNIPLFRQDRKISMNSIIYSIQKEALGITQNLDNITQNLDKPRFPTRCYSCSNQLTMSYDQEYPLYIVKDKVYIKCPSCGKASEVFFSTEKTLFCIRQPKIPVQLSFTRDFL